MTPDANGHVRDMLRSLPSLKGPFPPIDFSTFPDTPQQAFLDWLGDAIAGGIKEPHAMTLSTVDADGRADARMLILKNVDERGWHFATHIDSPKGRQLLANPESALTFYWAQLGRQVRIRGRAVPLPDRECAADFLERPTSARVIAMASMQSQPLHPAELADRLHDAQSLFDKNPHHVLSAWKVMAVAPRSAEFWQGASDRNHKRLCYSASDDGAGWVKAVLCA